MLIFISFCFEGDTLAFWLSKLEACALISLHGVHVCFPLG